LAITRRHLLQGGALAAVAPALGAATGLPVASTARAESATGEPVWRHALSLFGNVKYPADFARFDYVNPDAPKGGVARQIAIGTFDNFNPTVAGVKGSIAAAVGLIYESLTTPAEDEVSTEYGALA
jgi:microcin C transport system substrate-binding protein